MPMQSDYAQRHFQLRLTQLYARLCHNPWRQNILYLGDKGFLPRLSPEKAVYWGTTETGSTHSQAFPLWLSSYDELPFGDGSMDVIICHFSQPLESLSFLRECHRVMAPEGKCVWTWSNPYSPYYLGRSKESESFWIWEAKRQLAEYDFEILSMRGHSFLTRSSSPLLAKICLRWEKYLCQYIPFWANKLTFIAIKKTAHYSPLPSYLRLSHRVLWDQPCEL